ncbi:hypothetical protein [Flavisolibacter nicotianae]|uniref:hypothetical protein n=1 Tax=Flavisolibacter nicotianae TaxID=2364882 RepID=UPI0013C49D62|nr:hypothetical protein [Flavisolibacter nicotianae]
MRVNLVSIILISLLILGAASCKRKDFLMNIKFGLSDTLMKAETNRLVKDGEVFLEVKGDDTTYYHNIDVDGNIYKAQVYFNSDALKTGPLRSYDYSLTTVPFAQSGNDTVSKDGYKVTHWEIFKASDFEKLKSYLDKKYGSGVFSTNKGTFGNDTIYKYETKEADLLLTHGKKEDGLFWGVPVKVPFYTLAYLEIKSKSYEADYAKERERRRKELKPEEVVWINFDPPKIRYDENSMAADTSFFSFSSNPEPVITINANSETYATHVIDEDITECKGILSIMDAYDDTLTKTELIYKFRTPLRSPAKQEWRVMNYNSYKLNLNSYLFEKIKRLIQEGNTLKTRFTPTAVVLENGDVIK